MLRDVSGVSKDELIRSFYLSLSYRNSGPTYRMGTTTTTVVMMLVSTDPQALQWRSKAVVKHRL